MSYQTNAKTVTTTKDGQPVDIRRDFTTKTVSVFIGGEYQGTWKCDTAAKDALDLVDVAKGKK